MARNALMPQMQMYEAPQGPNVGNFINPLMAGIKRGDDLRQQGFQNERALTAEAQNKRRLDMQIDEHEYTKRKHTIDEIGNLAVAADAEQDPAKRAQIHSAILARHPNADNLPPMYRDPMVGPRLLMAEAGKAKNKLDDDYKQSQIGLNKAHTNFYNSRAAALSSQPAAAPQAAPVADPLQDAGIDEDGNIIAPGRSAAPKAPAKPSYGPGQGETWQLPGQMPAPMRLGGPRDDIDASMRLDEGRGGVPPVRVAQAQDMPSQMDQAKARMYGPTGVTSPGVPGVVTDAGRNRRVDVPATREMQGQRAMDAASPEQQEKLRAFRQDQELWAGVFKRQPRPGYYYGPDGRELSLQDKNYKGDKEMQAQALLNKQKMKQASDILLGINPRDPNKTERSGVIDRAIPGYFNIGETGQALADLKQAALGIAYSLSGKTVAVAEMKNFVDAYGPQWNDTNARVKAKVERMNQFYDALISATRGGQDYDKAFARAMAVMGVKNPDGTNPGVPSGPLSASDGDRAVKRAPDLSGVSTEDLLRQLNGGR